MRKRIRPKVLFVDDDPAIHDYARAISQRQKLISRHVTHPDSANRLIDRRLIAIKRLLAYKQKKRAETTDRITKFRLTHQIRMLETLKTTPFDLIVCDINMPNGCPVGLGFARSVKQRFKNQKIIMHSDDYETMEILVEELGIPNVYKGFYRERDLEKGISEQLPKRKRKQIN